VKAVRLFYFGSVAQLTRALLKLLRCLQPQMGVPITCTLVGDVLYAFLSPTK
jgi:hypothetical protein